MFALFYLQLVPDITGDVIITIKSDSEDAFHFKVTGHHSKKDGQVEEHTGQEDEQNRNKAK